MYIMPKKMSFLHNLIQEKYSITQLKDQTNQKLLDTAYEYFFWNLYLNISHSSNINNKTTVCTSHILSQVRPD